LSLKAGAKLKLLFVSRKKNLKKIETFFSSLFFFFSFQSLNELPCFAGCKCKKHFQISQAFSNLFFENFFSFNSYSCQYFCERFSLLRVQKYHLYLHLQAFSLYNFNLFSLYFLTIS
jgi:hypothetical protein